MGLWDKLSQRITDLVDDITAPEHQRELMQRGHALLQKGAAAEAEAVFAKVVAQDPGSGRALYLLGLSQRRQGKLAEAQKSLRAAREQRPDDFATLLALAEAQREDGRLAEALQTYREALTRRADDALLSQAFAGLGEIFLSRGEIERAVRELRKAAATAKERDLRLLGRLGEAQARSGALELAGKNLALAATATPPDPAALLWLSRVMLALGRADQAHLAALRLVETHPDHEAGRLMLARGLLALRRLEEARLELMRALERAPRSSAVHQLMAEVHRASHDPQAALRHLRLALQAGLEGTTDDVFQQAATVPLGPEQVELQPPAVTTLLRETLALELDQADVPAELGADARRLLELAPEDPLALAALARAEDPSGDAALDAVERSLAVEETYVGQRVRGEILLARGELEGAAAALRAALRLRPRDSRAQALLSRLFTAMSAAGPVSLSRPAPVPAQPMLTDSAAPASQAEAGPDVYGLLHRTHALLMSHPDLMPLAADVARAQQVFDRPLLVTVMGEFNSGKSTFVNALIGEEVAPMGVTPTTATINVLKYGAERGARIVWQDDREELVRWEDVGAFLRGLAQDRARQVRVVELLYPSEELLRVNVVDTPGLNSMIDEHEATAREYMAQADAVIWLFSAIQAGSQTQARALEVLHQHRLKTVGVLNKVDQLTPDELARVKEHLAESFAGLTETLLAVSARRALSAITAEDAAALEGSQFPALRRYLEQQLFEQSRAIKREAAERRLAEVLEGAEQKMAGAVDAAERALSEVEAMVCRARELMPAGWQDEERRHLLAEQRAVYRQGAGEVLDFVRPRGWWFGEHSATDADRDFLLEMLQEGTRQLADGSFDRVATALRAGVQSLQVDLERAVPGEESGVGRALRPDLGRLVDERLALLRQQVYTRYRAFARGVLRGGRVDHFFTHQLPRLELTHDAVFASLLEDGVDLEAELLEPLATWVEQTHEAFAQALDRLQDQIGLSRLELERRYLLPLTSLKGGLRQGD